MHMYNVYYIYLIYIQIMTCLQHILEKMLYYNIKHNNCTWQNTLFSNKHHISEPISLLFRFMNFKRLM